jgi:hypothetical protein
MASEVEKVAEFKDANHYRTSCRCGSSDHCLDMYIEYDKDADWVTVDMSIEMARHEEFYDSLPYVISDLLDRDYKGRTPKRELLTDWIWNTYHCIARRISDACKILFTGRVETSGDFIFRGKEQIQELVDALYESANRIEGRNKR